jgi:tetratricopeptide (TPR) repeat protein
LRGLPSLSRRPGKTATRNSKVVPSDVLSNSQRLSERLQHTCIKAEAVGHLAWKSTVSNIAKERTSGKSGPIVLVGHSQGANNVIEMARLLERKKIPVELYGIPVVSERRFLEWTGKAATDTLNRVYSVGQITLLSKLSHGTVQELTRFGLLNPRGGLFGFRDLASARQISKLFAHGIAFSEIIRSVKAVRAWLPDADLSNLRLHPAAHHAIEIEQPEGRADKRGQFVLPVSPLDTEADALFDRAQSAEDAGDFAESERLYRVLMKCDPTDAAPPFNLGNMLRANGRKVEAEAAFRAATRADPAFAEAWYNLSDLLDEQGRSEVAIDCLRSAVRAAPNYADAIFNLALLLQRSNQHSQAAEYWRRYLLSDGQSEWAARARRSLKFCEMQVHLSAS